MTRPTVVVTLLASLAAVGCQPAHSELEVRASREFSCPEDQVQVEELGADGYRVWACGWYATYVCGRTGGWMVGGYRPSHTTCMREGPPVRYDHKAR